MDLSLRGCVTSLLDIYELKFMKKLFKKIPENCEQLGFKNPGIQTSVHGKICGSSKGGKKLEIIDKCSNIETSAFKAFCYDFLWEYFCKYH